MFLVRHGESEANARRVIQGLTIDEPLSEHGRRQAKSAAECLAKLPISAVYSSGLLRAAETARAIAGQHGLNVETIGALHEVDVGRWAGQTWEEIRRQTPDLWKDYMADLGDVPTPGGESYRNVLDRVQPIFDRLLARHAGESFAVVAHNVVNKVYLADLLGIELRRSPVLRQSNGGINVIRRDNGQTVVVTVNSELHLQCGMGILPM